MRKIKIIAGVTWALAGLILILILFPGLNSFSSSAARLPFMKINPNYSGGEVAKQLFSQCCTVDIRRPVFDGLLKERKKLIDTIDYDLNGIPDFLIQVDRNSSESQLVPFNPHVINVEISTLTSYGWAVRVGIKK
jgi:hypothetical protein